MKTHPRLLLALISSVAITSGVSQSQAASISLTNSDTVASFFSKGNWNDGVAPHAGNSYFTAGYILRGPANLANSDTNYVFQGDSLSLDAAGALYMKTTNRVTINNLILNGGMFYHASSGATPDRVLLAGNVTLAPTTLSTISLTGGGTRLINFLAPFNGAGNLQLIGAASSIVYLSASNIFGGGSLTNTIGKLQLNDLNALHGLGNVTVTNTSSVGAQILAPLDGTYYSVPLFLAGNGLPTFTATPGALCFSNTTGIWPGAIVSLNDNATVSISSTTGSTNTLSGPLGGAYTLTLRGYAPSGPVDEGFILTGTSTNTGTLRILATNSANVYVWPVGGENRLSSVAPLALSAASSLTAQFDLNGLNQQVGGLISSGAGIKQLINSGAAAVTLTISNSATHNFDGVLGPNSDNITLIKQGSGVQVLSGYNTFLGNTTVSGGTLRVDGSLGSGTRAVTIRSGGMLGGGGSVVDAVTVQSGGGLSPGAGVAAPGTLGLTSLALNGASLQMDLDAANNTTGAGVNDLIQVNGVLNVSGTIEVSLTFLNGLPVAGTTYTLISAASLASGAASNFTLAPGSGVVAAFDTTSTPGSVLMTIQSGNIAPLVWLGTHGHNWDLSSLNWSNTLTGNPDKFVGLDPVTFDDSSTNPTVNLVGQLLTGPVAFNNSLLNYTLGGSGSIAGFNNVTLNGTATVTLATDNTYTGGTMVNAGTLKLGNGGTNGSVVGGITDNSLVVFDRTDTVTSSNSIDGFGALVKANTNTLILVSNNVYSGGTTISNGTLQLGNGGATGSLQGDIVNNGVLQINRSANLTLSGLISGSGSLQQVGGATTVLTADNSYAGGTTVAAGTLQLGNNGGSGQVVGDITNNAALIFNRGADLDFTNIIRGAGSVTKNGNGALTFTVNQPFTGALTAGGGTLVLTNVNSQTNTIFSNGILVVGNSGALGTGGLDTTASTPTGRLELANNVTVLAGKTFRLYARNNLSTAVLNTSGSNTIATSISLDAGGSQYHVESDTGTLAIGGFSGLTATHTLHLQGNGNGLVYGPITGAGPLVMDGPGTWVLTGASSYDTTTISAGTLQIGNGGSSGTLGNGVVTINSALVLNRSGSYTVANYLTGSGMLTHLGSGTATFSSTNDYTGPTAVLGGVLLINGTLANSPVSVARGAALGGQGTIFTPVTLDPGSVLAPGTAAIGTLTVSNDLALSGNLLVKLDKSLDQPNDQLVVSGLLTNAGTGSITLTNLGPGLATGDTFRLFNQPLANGGALTVTPLAGISWTNRLAWDGTIAVTYAPPLVSTNPPYLTNAVSGTHLQLSWPADHLGWRLEVQTNGLTTGLSTNWYTWPGSATNTSESIPMVPGNPTVFFRLIYP